MYILLLLLFLFAVNESVPMHIYTSSSLLLSVFAVNDGVHIHVVCCVVAVFCSRREQSVHIPVVYVCLFCFLFVCLFFCCCFSVTLYHSPVCCGVFVVLCSRSE